MTLDTDIADMERRWKKSGIPGLYSGSGPECRERARNIRALLHPKPKLATGRIEPLGIPSAAGEVPARVIWPHGGAATSTLVYFHGGGWIVGDIDSHEAHCVRIANATGAVVVSVGYRLAPEDPFPAGVDDAWVAMQWAHAHLDSYGGAGRPLAVGGDSAGGNLAAVVAVHSRDAGIALAAQFLLYPATDLTGMNDPLVRDKYLGANGADKARDPRVSPLLSATLAGVAPAIIGVGVYDFLYKDNLAYAQALRAAGVPLLLREFAGLNHGFFSYTGISKACEVAAEGLCVDLRQALAGERLGGAAVAAKA